ncbi:MAG: RNA polymerase sigma-70 factor, ECF subfamily [Chloroflexi bacterium]|jgi:RNA polymerase sigma-70 factor (ECF subfamily)|nr:MAG: RNA polymerase sigma-70 factor, ECF subfamily [Chloroflexota bacterium]
MELRRVVDEAGSGSAVAFQQLFESYAGDVGRYVNAITRRPDLAEDLVAETFLRVWKQLPSLRESERFEAWLFRIAHHVAVDAVRARRPSESDDLLIALEQETFRTPVEWAEARADRAFLQAALEGLSEEHREVITLRFLLELSSKEVAAQMGRSDDAIRQLQHRALAQLRSLITHAAYDSEAA